MPGLRLFDDVKQRTAGCVGIRLVAGLILLSFAGAMAVAQTGAQAASSLNALMPLPATLEPRGGLLPIDGSFSYALSGDTGPRVRPAAERLIQRLETRTGVSMSELPAAQGTGATLSVDVATGSAADVVQPGVDESYTRRPRAMDMPFRVSTSKMRRVSSGVA